MCTCGQIDSIPSSEKSAGRFDGTNFMQGEEEQVFGVQLLGTRYYCVALFRSDQQRERDEALIRKTQTFNSLSANVEIPTHSHLAIKGQFE